MSDEVEFDDVVMSTPATKGELALVTLKLRRLSIACRALSESVLVLESAPDDLIDRFVSLDKDFAEIFARLTGRGEA